MPVQFFVPFLLFILPKKALELFVKPVGQLLQLVFLHFFNLPVSLVFKVVQAFLKCIIHKLSKSLRVVNRGGIFLSLILDDLVFKHVAHLTLNDEVDPIIELKALRDCVRINEQPFRNNRLSANLDFGSQDLFLQEDGLQQQKNQVGPFYKPQF